MRNFDWTSDLFNTACIKHVHINKQHVLIKMHSKTVPIIVHMYKSKPIKYKSRIRALLEISSFSFRPITNCTSEDSVLVCPRNISKIVKARRLSSMRNVALIGRITNAFKFSAKTSLNRTVQWTVLWYYKIGDRLRTLAKTKINIRVPKKKKADNFLIDYATIKLLRKTVLH